MKTYKELRDELFEEVSKIDISKLSIGFGGLSDYVDLLNKMSQLPDESLYEKCKNGLSQGFGGFPAPKIEGGK